jgi:glycosyltransferase involved in cell wall biosynthesis
MPERVSVVLGTFNGEPFVGQQLASVLAQSRGADEIVVSDDASADGCVDRLRGLLDGFAGDVQIHVNAATLGVTRNFERAMRLATGDICFLCDQDDVWRSDKVQRMVAAFEREPGLMLLHSDARIIDAAGTPMGKTLLRALRISRRDLASYDSGQALCVLLRRNIVTGATVAVRRRLLEWALPVPDGYWHDEWLALIAAALGAIKRIPEPLIDYRIHPGNQAGLRAVTPAARIGAATSGRGDFHAIRARKLDALLERLRSLGSRVQSGQLCLVEACRDHWRVRANLPQRRTQRVASILAEWGGGRYGRFSNGWRGVLRDLVEPLP